MMGQKLQHMIQKRDRGLDPGFPGPVQLQGQANLGFFRLSVYFSDPLRGHFLTLNPFTANPHRGGHPEA